MKTVISSGLITLYAFAAHAVAATDHPAETHGAPIAPAHTTATAPAPTVTAPAPTATVSHPTPEASAPAAPAAQRPPAFGMPGGRPELSPAAISNNLVALSTNQLALMTRFLGLTDKQQEQIRGLQSTRMAEEVALRTARQELSRSLRASTNRADMIAKSKTLTDRLNALVTRFDDECKALLTPEQSAKWVGLDTYANVIASFRNCAFTPEQDAQIQTLCVERSPQKPEPAPGGTTPIYRLLQEIEAKVLTDAQREERLQRNLYPGIIARFAKANLTDEQGAAIREMLKAKLSQFAAAKSDNKATYALKAQLFDEIREKVLTEEQRALTAPVKGSSAPYPAPTPAPAPVVAPAPAKLNPAETPAEAHATDSKPHEGH